MRGRMSAQKLADLTEELGCRVSPDVLFDLESGRRRYVTVPELTVLARALNTTPVALLYPDPINGETMMLPKVEAGQGFALQWFSGHVDATAVSERAVCNDAAAYNKNLRRIEIARAIWELNDQRAELMKAREGLSGADQRDYLIAMAELTRQIKKLKESDDGR